MELSEIKERLEKLDSNKLMNVVKNYRQYGYSDEIRNYALSLLEEQGITKSDLQLTGNFENANYVYANDVFASFKKNSKLAFVFYGLLAVFKLISIFFQLYNTIILAGLILALVLFIIFLFQSFLYQSKFYKLTGDEYAAAGGIAYLVLGMPLYVIMYFVFQSQMNEKLKMVT